LQSGKKAISQTPKTSAGVFQEADMLYPHTMCNHGDAVPGRADRDSIVSCGQRRPPFLPLLPCLPGPSPLPRSISLLLSLNIPLSNFPIPRPSPRSLSPFFLPSMPFFLPTSSPIPNLRALPALSRCLFPASPSPPTPFTQLPAASASERAFSSRFVLALRSAARILAGWDDSEVIV